MWGALDALPRIGAELADLAAPITLCAAAFAALALL